MGYKKFFCWSLKTSVRVTVFFTIVAGTLAAILEILDIVAFFSSFEIGGSMKSSWRAHVWDGWLATNIVMLFCHVVMIGYSILAYFALERFPYLYEYFIMRIYLALMVAYILVELGISCYRYAWYGPNTFRLPYIVFTFFFWIFRTICNICFVIILASHRDALAAKLDPSEIEDLSDSKFAYTRIGGSGFSTPRSGYMTPAGTSTMR